MDAPPRTILLTGATGFIGRALMPRLLAAGHRVRAATRHPPRTPTLTRRLTWVRCDLLEPRQLEDALRGANAAYYLVHSMGKGQRDFREVEQRQAHAFADAAARAGLSRIIYLGGVAPAGVPSEHLASRLEVGEILRAGKVPTLELRASMIIGVGSASWQIVRDLAMRLPAMVLPKWLDSVTCPLALEDAVEALVRALELPLEGSAWFDLPGPDVVSGRDILMRLAALRGRRVPALRVPVLTPYLSSLWLKFVTRADFSLARELVAGLTEDLLPVNRRYWELIDYTPKWGFDEAAKRALAEEAGHPRTRGVGSAIEELLVERFGPKLKA
ncbi:MAG: NAD(P)H-binding protein [Myxococcaceae bacterium]